MDLLEHVEEPERAPTKETRGRPRKVLIRCENVRGASFTTDKGERIRPGQTAEVPAKLAKAFVEQKVAVYVKAGECE